MDAKAIVRAVHFITVGKQYALASYALAVYEYFITVDREVDSMWRRRFTLATLLWYMNRYVLHISFIPTILAFFIPMSPTQCQNFVKYPGAMQILLNVSTGVTLTIRVFALYGQAKWVLYALIPPLIAEVGIEAWAVSDGVGVPLPPGIPGCILTGKPEQGNRFAAFWIGQLIFPTLIFLLTIAKAVKLRLQGQIKNGIITTMLRDGIMYFLVIFIANLANVLMYPLAPEEIKFINAPFTNVISSLMICRLMLNLKRGREPPMPLTLMTISFPGARSSVATVGTTATAQAQARYRNYMYIGDLDQDLDIDSAEHEKERRELEKTRRMRESDWQRPDYIEMGRIGMKA